MSAVLPASAHALGRVRWALLFGNFVVGCGVFVVAGRLNDIGRSLQVLMYLGQAVGACGGGWLIGHGGYAPLHWAGVLCVLAALGLSLWVGRRAASGERT